MLSRAPALFARAFLAVALVPGCGFDRDTSLKTGDTDVIAGADTPGDGSLDETTGPCNACSGAASCGAGAGCHAGVCIVDPPEGSSATITDPVSHKPTEDPPNLACVADDPALAEQTGTATVYGAVTRFGSGRKTFQVQVDIFLASTWDPSGCEQEPAAARDACYVSYGDAIGSTLSVPPEVVDLPDNCDGHASCPLGYECLEGDLDYVCEEQFGVYAIEGIPTDVPLVIRARATEFESKWHDTYVFNVVLHGDLVDEDGSIHYNATMVSHGQWLLTANTVGLSDIPEDRGAIGGRMRDCRLPGERPSWPISEASVGLTSPPEKTVFFNSLEDDTVPLDDRTTTNILGRYAALDIAAGWNTVAGSGRVAGEVVSLGSAAVYVMPNSLSIVTFPGLQPHWRQE